MGALDPIAFDIETSGLEHGAVITVVGLATDMGAWLALNTTGRDAAAARVERAGFASTRRYRHLVVDLSCSQR